MQLENKAYKIDQDCSFVMHSPLAPAHFLNSKLSPNLPKQFKKFNKKGQILIKIELQTKSNFVEFY